MAQNMKYSELVEECKDTLTEYFFNSRWSRIEGYWQVGKLVIDNDLAPEKLAKFAKAIKIDIRDLSTAILLAYKYPNLNDMPANKAVSWSQIHKYLHETKNKKS